MIDLRGHGKSESPPVDIEEAIKFLELAKFNNWSCSFSNLWIKF
jgi:hypothetical protein